MKKIFVALLFTTAIIPGVSAQVTPGLKAGLGLSNAKNIGSKDNTAALRINAGGFVQIPISGSFLFQPELLYSGKGYKFPKTNFSGSGDLHLNYICLPLLLGYWPLENFSILAGPELGFLTSANSVFDGQDHDVKRNFKKFDTGIDVGVMYYLGTHIAVELRYSHGFEDLSHVIYTDMLGNVIGQDNIGANRVFQLGLSFFVFRKKIPMGTPKF